MSALVPPPSPANATSDPTPPSSAISASPQATCATNTRVDTSSAEADLTLQRVASRTKSKGPQPEDTMDENKQFEQDAPNNQHQQPMMSRGRPAPPPPSARPPPPPPPPPRRRPPRRRSPRPPTRRRPEEKEHIVYTRSKDECSNALVLVMCISEYTHNKNLKGARKDAETYYRVFGQKYGYDVFPTSKDRKWYGRRKWTRGHIQNFIKEGRELLKDADGGLRYDSLIVAICGHGDEGVILPSDWHPRTNPGTVHIADLHEMVSTSWMYDAASIPRVFAIDCCRGLKTVAVADTKGGARGGGRQHPNALLFSIFGNSLRYKVFENGDGGCLSQSLLTAMEGNLKRKKDLREVLKVAREHLFKKAGDKQLVVTDGDLLVSEKVFVRNPKTDV